MTYITYDSDANAVYIYVQSKRIDNKLKTKMLWSEQGSIICADFDGDRLFGIEILLHKDSDKQ